MSITQWSVCALGMLLCAVAGMLVKTDASAFVAVLTAQIGLGLTCQAARNK